MHLLRERARCTVASEQRITVSVVYALPDRQTVRTLEVPDGATVADALAASGLLESIPDLEQPPKCAIFSRLVAPTEVLRAGDRVEILRPLLVDPKEGRRRVAAQSTTRAPTSARPGATKGSGR